MKNKPTIIFYESEDWEKPILKKALPKAFVKFSPDPLTPKTAIEARWEKATIISPFIYSSLSANVLRSLHHLDMIATRSTGFDHIDTEFCKKHSIVVSNVPTYGENTVAEHTFALILSLSRKIFQAYERTEKYTFTTDGLRGFDLKDKTIGIIGCGNIGKHVARMANGFEMNVLISDPYIQPSVVKKLHAKAVPLSQLLASSDIITLHAPYSKKTHHLLNKKNIKKIKTGAFLINTSRGGLVDTSALIWALNKKILSGAGLDVLEEECAVKEESQILSKNWPKECNLQTVLENHQLVKRDDVIITPHNAFNSTEALERILNTTIENIQAFLKGRPQNRV